MYNIIFIIDTLQTRRCNFLHLRTSHIMPPKKEVKPLPDNIYNVPEDIATIRKNLFQVNDIVTLSLEEYNKYWPYVDNVWSSKGTPDTLKDGSIVEYFRCQCYPTVEHIPANEGWRKRQKASHNALGCKMRIRVTKNCDLISIRQTGKWPDHVHTLDDIEARKRSSAFRDLAAIEVAKNYTPSEVARNLRAVNRPEDQKLLIEVGRWHLSLKDVHNASAAWKKEHPNQKRRGNLSDWEEQRLDIREWLESEKWHVENIKVYYLFLLKTFI